MTTYSAPLHRAVTRALADAGLEIVSATAEPWRSATFSGWRHAIHLSGDGESGDMAAIEDAVEAMAETLSVPGCIVADVTLAGIQADGYGIGCAIRVLLLRAE